MRKGGSRLSELHIPSSYLIYLDIYLIVVMSLNLFMGNFKGPIVGAITLIAIPEILRFLQLPEPVVANVRLLAYGLLLIIMVHVRPQGLAGEYRFK